ncbi:hypothetical protein BLNAU_21344 [Blattamonas nauphoetae]|uniref:Uncharacterized protein n=1 Tax=Blattamonas nauphoetae TaxID=2049346 RepID=A0ABQ9WW58_9EUKA|nr:hypothetical protein BLNAU_21344 [Blattamonas nauphoetae]
MLTTTKQSSYVQPLWSSFLLSEPISEGIVAISFTSLTKWTFGNTLHFGLIDGTAPIPKGGQALGKIKREWMKFSLSKEYDHVHPLVVEVNMDSNPRTAMFFVDNQSPNLIVVGLPESVRVGFSAMGQGRILRFDRITHLNRGSPFTDQMKVIEWPAAKPLQVTQSNEYETYFETKKRHLTKMKLPELLFTHKSHFTIRNNVLTRTDKGANKNGRTKPSTVLFSEPITKGVVSVAFVVLTLAESVNQKGFINFGLLDSSMAVPQLGDALGKDVNNSVCLEPDGNIRICTQTRLIGYHSSFSKSDRIVMEVNMDSTPRTVQFFVNGKACQRYVSGIPESVRIGFSAHMLGTSLEITNIVHSTQPTPITEMLREIKWTDTEPKLKERIVRSYFPIRREAEGSMPALLFRDPEHFKIEGNVITRTAVDINGLASPFSTVMLDRKIDKSIKSVSITILALPQTNSSCGVIMIGCQRESPVIPESPKGLGFGTDASFALCSIDGMIHRIDKWKLSSKPCHSQLKVGDRVLIGVNTRLKHTISHFFVNGNVGQNGIFGFERKQRIGFSLAGPGTSIRIDAITETGQLHQIYKPSFETWEIVFDNLCLIFGTSMIRISLFYLFLRTREQNLSHVTSFGEQVVSFHDFVRNVKKHSLWFDLIRIRFECQYTF